MSCRTDSVRERIKCFSLINYSITFSRIEGLPETHCASKTFSCSEPLPPTSHRRECEISVFGGVFSFWAFLTSLILIRKKLKQPTRTANNFFFRNDSLKIFIYSKWDVSRDWVIQLAIEISNRNIKIFERQRKISFSSCNDGDVTLQNDKVWNDTTKRFKVSQLIKQSRAVESKQHERKLSLRSSIF